jgi:hypothetical protein
MSRYDPGNNTDRLEGAPMNLEISTEERDFLQELLEEKHKGLIHEINHTDTDDFEEMLKRKVEVVEQLKGKLSQ